MRALALIVLGSIAACDTVSTDGSTPSPPDTGPGTVSSDVPEQFRVFTEGVTVWMDGDVLVVESTGVPDHDSPYFDTSDSRYEAYNGGNASFHLNPNRIAAQDHVFRIPAEPAALDTPSPTPLGPIGVSLNGVPFYNQYAGPDNQPLTREIDSFDQYNGHPQQHGGYHYHAEPYSLTDRFGSDALLGFLLDGYPVYGPEENGVRVRESDLDMAHGHEHATEEYPEGVYHYHVTDVDPYINGAGFHGQPGTASW
ncbi:MAG: YHYH protein [Bacteroidota bacterium]